MRVERVVCRTGAETSQSTCALGRWNSSNPHRNGNGIAGFGVAAAYRSACARERAAGTLVCMHRLRYTRPVERDILILILHEMTLCGHTKRAEARGNFRSAPVVFFQHMAYAK